MLKNKIRQKKEKRNSVSITNEEEELAGESKKEAVSPEVTKSQLKPGSVNKKRKKPFVKNVSIKKSPKLFKKKMKAKKFKNKNNS